MNLILDVPDDLAERLCAGGANPAHVALAALNQAADALARGAHPTPPDAARRTPAEAAARMRASRAGNILPEGVAIRDLMTHGRA